MGGEGIEFDGKNEMCLPIQIQKDNSQCRRNRRTYHKRQSDNWIGMSQKGLIIHYKIRPCHLQILFEPILQCVYQL